MVDRRHVSVCATLIVVSLIGILPCAAQSADPLLSPVFQDHVVLQRDQPVRVWGRATSGDTVRVVVGGKTASARVDEDGAWSAQLPALSAGGPYQLIARSTNGAVQMVDDVLVGDVYLCAGQSNMALPVRRTLNSPAEIGGAENDRIRMLTVPNDHSAAPKQTLPASVGWETASPETVGDWSAACYYFARELQSHVDVPLGLLHSSWGGTSITAWMSADALAEVGGYQKDLALLNQYANDRQTAQQTFGAQWEATWRTAVGDTVQAPWRPSTGAQWPRAPETLGDWKSWGVPALSEFTGAVWFRATVDLTAEQARRDAVLSLGRIDAVDQTWMNGTVVGNTFGWGTPRTYTIPARRLQPGENVVVVNVLNTYGQGGMLPAPPSRVLITGTGDRRPLRDWRYQKGRPEFGRPPRTPWEPIAGRSTLHNAMLAPLHDYALRGAVWYQGESDTDMGRQYLAHMQGLKAQWRDQFGADLPVLIVQLANYGPQPTAPTESGWAEVREAQRRAVQGDPNAGLAVTIDVGSPDDIHPANKQAVGRRLARTGRRVVYGQDDSASGPAPVRATRQGDQVLVTFRGATEGLVAYSHTRPIGFELCAAGDGPCHYAEAQIEGDRVLLTADEVDTAGRVRYCWADSPVCTLYDGAGLPAPPFELEVSDAEGP